MTKDESPIVFMRASEFEFELQWAREAEREACAKLCEAEMFRETQNPDKAEVAGIRLGARLCAGYIRARGNSES